MLTANSHYMKVIIINGPNLNLLGTREPEIYGTQTFDDFFEKLMLKYSEIDLQYFQSNVEGEIIDKLQEVGFTYDGIVLNAAGYTHTSIAIADAVAAIKSAVVEVHISNPYAREDFRQRSLIAPKAKAIICGMGLKGYEFALQFLIDNY
jgi:3-dehydroquinate dehydratase II